MAQDSLLIPNPDYDPAKEAELIRKEVANGGHLGDADFTTFVRVSEFVPGTEYESLKKMEVLGILSAEEARRLQGFRNAISEETAKAVSAPPCPEEEFRKYIVDPSTDAPGRISEAFIRSRYILFFPEDNDADSKSTADIQLALFARFKSESIVDAFEFLFAREWQRWNKQEQEIVYNSANVAQKKYLDRIGACALLHCI